MRSVERACSSETFWRILECICPAVGLRAGVRDNGAAAEDFDEAEFEREYAELTLIVAALLCLWLYPLDCVVCVGLAWLCHAIWLCEALWLPEHALVAGPRLSCPSWRPRRRRDRASLSPRGGRGGVSPSPPRPGSPLSAARPRRRRGQPSLQRRGAAATG